MLISDERKNIQSGRVQETAEYVDKKIIGVPDEKIDKNGGKGTLLSDAAFVKEDLAFEEVSALDAVEKATENVETFDFGTPAGASTPEASTNKFLPPEEVSDTIGSDDLPVQTANNDALGTLITDGDGVGSPLEIRTEVPTEAQAVELEIPKYSEEESHIAEAPSGADAGLFGEVPTETSAFEEAPKDELVVPSGDAIPREVVEKLIDRLVLDINQVIKQKAEEAKKELGTALSAAPEEAKPEVAPEAELNKPASIPSDIDMPDIYKDALSQIGNISEGPTLG